MSPSALSRSRRFLATFGPYSLAAMSLCIGIAAAGWTIWLDRSLPPHTPVTAAGELLVAVVPMFMVTLLIIALFLALWDLYVVLVWGQTLRQELREEREGRDRAIADAVVTRLATGKGEADGA